MTMSKVMVTLRGQRSCNGVAYIPKVAKGFKTSKEYKDIKPAIKSYIQHLKEFRTTIQTDLEDLHKERDVALKEIKDYRKSIEMEFDRMERKITDEVHTKVKTLQAEINANKKSVEDTMANLQSSLRELESIKSDNEAEMFVYVKKGNIKITESDELLQNLNAITERGTLYFKQNLSIDECMKKYEKLGELQEEINNTYSHIPNKAKSVQVLPQKQSKLCSASLTGKYNVKVKKDTSTCHIADCTVLDDGRLLIRDGGNNKLKRLNSSFQITDYCDLPGKTYGICVTDNKEVAVAVADEKKNQFVSVGNKMKLLRSFTTIGACTELAYSNNNIIVANFKLDVLHIYSENGKCLRTIKVNLSDLNTTYDSFPRIALSTDHSKLHLSNKNNGIITVNMNTGQNDWVCTDKMTAARGLCVLDNDNILVADGVNNTIFQITDDGHMLGAVVQRNDGIRDPLNVCYDAANSRLIVTSSHFDKILVFKLKN